jgi:predicted secreted protein
MQIRNMMFSLMFFFWQNMMFLVLPLGVQLDERSDWLAMSALL